MILFNFLGIPDKLLYSCEIDMDVESCDTFLFLAWNLASFSFESSSFIIVVLYLDENANKSSSFLFDSSESTSK